MAVKDAAGDNGQPGGGAGGGNESQDQGGGAGGADRTAEGGEGSGADELFDSPEDRAAFDAMRSGGEVPGAGAADNAGAGDEAGKGGDQDAGDPAAGGAGADQGAGKKPAAAAAGEGDDADDADEAGQQAGDPPRRVSGKKYAALERQFAELQKKTGDDAVARARLEERLNLLNEALTAPAQQAEKKEDDDPEPDAATDIFAHNAWLSRQLKKEREARVALQTGTQQREQAATTSQNLKTQFESSVVAFAKDEPNFPDAYAYMMGTRMAELAAYFFGKDLYANEQLTPEETARIRQTVLTEEQRIVANALNNKRDPAKAIFLMAKGRGWKPPAAAAAGDGQQQQAPAAGAKPAANGAAGNGAGKPAANAGQQQQQPSVIDEVERIKRGQDASLSLSNGNGSPGSALTLDRLVNMDDDEFDVVLENMSAKQLQRIAGG